MFWHLLITPIVATLNALYNALPPWSPDIGQSWVHYGLVWLGPMDRFFPIHDAFLPALVVTSSIFVALNAVKWTKFLLSLIPTISAGG